MTAFPSYSTGTVAIAANAASVIGTGPNWSGQNAMPGDHLVVAGQTVIIQDVTDATHLAIDAWLFAAVAAGTPYKIYQDSPLRFVGAQAMTAVNQLVTALNTNGFYVFVGPTDTVPDPSLGDDNQYAFQATTGKQWQKVGGVWNFIGIFKGLGTPAAWDSATAYVPQDVVSLDGTSYVCIAANTNEMPSFGDSPPNAYWTVLAEKGDTGPQGIQGASYGGTSTTSLTIGTGSQAFTTQAGLAYTNGARVRASSAANTSNWMEGLAAYSGTALTVAVTKTNGSGTFADWDLNVVGEPGAGDLSSANNLSDVADADTALGNLGGLAKSANLSDVANAATARNNLGATGNLVAVTVFTASGTWTKAANTKSVVVEVVGGGGGGGGALATTLAQCAASGGGGGGGYSTARVIAPGATEIVTVGLGGATPIANGGTGGTSSFGAWCSATGGVGGQGSAAGGAANTFGGGGGAGSGGDLNLRGSAGQGGVGVVNSFLLAGSGGPAPLGGGGAGAVSNGVGIAGATFGGGGGGSCSNGVAVARAGGAGGGGGVIVWEYA